MARRGVEVCVADGLSGTPYRRIARIGGGTSAEVFEVEGPRGARRALKVLRAIHQGARDTASRLEREGRALARLNHPNLVRVIDAGVTADGRPYFAMPRLKGETLRERLEREGKLSPERAAELVIGLLDGLDAAHAAGIIHRDVKPANIFLVPQAKAIGAAPGFVERCVLFDFGIAKVEGCADATTTGAVIIGTPRYLAPEQILGGRVDGRTDVYAVGIVLFEMIAGRGPYDGDDSVELMHAHLTARRCVSASSRPSRSISITWSAARYRRSLPGAGHPRARSRPPPPRRCRRGAPGGGAMSIVTFESSPSSEGSASSGGASWGDSSSDVFAPWPPAPSPGDGPRKVPTRGPATSLCQGTGERHAVLDPLLPWPGRDGRGLRGAARRDRRSRSPQGAAPEAPRKA